MADYAVLAVQKHGRVLALFTTVMTECGYRNVANLYLHLVVEALFFLTFAVIMD